MMRRGLLRLMPALAVMTLPLRAADPSGRWTGTAITPEHSENVLLILEVSGSSVAGSLGPNDDRRFPIENGRFEGNKVSFQLSGPKGAVFHIDLTIDGDSLKGPCTRTADGQTENGQMDLKRAS